MPPGRWSTTPARTTGSIREGPTEGGRVQTSEMRAFSVYFDTLPLIMVNGGDVARGRLFSMLHEYAHLLLHTSGLCDPVTASRATDPDSQLEVRCNAIAAAMLMPADVVLGSQEVRDRIGRRDSWDYEALRDAAAPFGASAEAFARRLLTLSRIDRAFYQEYRARLLQRYEQEEATGPGGGNFYRTKARDLGKGFVRRVADAYHRRVIDSYTAATFLSVKVDQIDRLAEMASLSESA